MVDIMRLSYELTKYIILLDMLPSADIWSWEAEGCKSHFIICEKIHNFSHNFKFFQMQTVIRLNTVQCSWTRSKTPVGLRKIMYYFKYNTIVLKPFCFSGPDTLTGTGFKSFSSTNTNAHQQSHYSACWILYM